MFVQLIFGEVLPECDCYNRHVLREEMMRVAVVPTESCYILCTCYEAHLHILTLMLCCER